MTGATANPAWTLETPTIADAPELSAMAQASFTDTFAYMQYPPADLERFLDSAMGAATYARQIADPDYAIRIARWGGDCGQGAICGFIKLGPNELPLPPGEPQPAPTPASPGTRELHQLYLTGAAQGTGLADALMAFALADARGRGAEALYLSVYVGNLKAQRFYTRHGFVEIGKVAFAVGDTIDDDRLWRRYV